MWKVVCTVSFYKEAWASADFSISEEILKPILQILRDDSVLNILFRKETSLEQVFQSIMAIVYN